MIVGIERDRATSSGNLRLVAWVLTLVPALTLALTLILILALTLILHSADRSPRGPSDRVVIE